VAGYTQSIEELIECLVKLPGIGRRSAERIVNYIISATLEEAQVFSDSIRKVKETVHFCSSCNNLSEQDTCMICQDSNRKKEIVCIVEKPSDVNALEKSGTYQGVYHVLHGSIAPLEGKGPEDLKVQSLIKRIQNNEVKEIIIATDADTEGETTAYYLAKMIKPHGIKITRIGVGIPMGSNVEYSDPSTLSIALNTRREL
jgi:recombination protein RecR